MAIVAGTAVVSGEYGAEDYETGVVVETRHERYGTTEYVSVLVQWDSDGVRTECLASSLREILKPLASG